MNFFLSFAVIGRRRLRVFGPKGLAIRIGEKPLSGLLHSSGSKDNLKGKGRTLRANAAPSAAIKNNERTTIGAFRIMKNRMLLSTADHPDRLKAKFRAALGRAQMLGFPSVDIGSVPFEAIAEKMIKPVEQGNALRKKEPEFYPAEFTLFGGVDGDLFEAELRCEVNGAFVVLESQTEDESLPQRQVTVEMPEGMPVTVDSIRSAMDRAGVPVADRPSEDAIREAILMAAAAARQELQAEGESSP